MAIIAKLPATSRTSSVAQQELPLGVECRVERDGIGMGVLRDGTAFLNQRGLGELCGVRNKYIGQISSAWSEPETNSAVQRIQQILIDQGSEVPESTHIATKYGNRTMFVYPDSICMAVIEYYAFDANLAGQALALKNYRRLARHGLRSFIYTETGYAPRETNDLWRIFKDRVELTHDAVPRGYFGIFRELSGLVVTLGLAGLQIDENFVPDISVGKAWARHWEAGKLADTFGSKATYAHNFPRYFPQAASNPQMAACYPEAALGEFRRWFRDEYIGDGRFKKYLSKKVTERLLPEGYVEKAMLALTKE